MKLNPERPCCKIATRAMAATPALQLSLRDYAVRDAFIYLAIIGSRLSSSDLARPRSLLFLWSPRRRCRCGSRGRSNPADLARWAMDKFKMVSVGRYSFDSSRQAPPADRSMTRHSITCFSAQQQLSGARRPLRFCRKPQSLLCHDLSKSVQSL